MANSKELQLASLQEDNDIKSFALQCKALREKRSEKWLEDWYPVLKERYPIEERNNSSYSITTQDYGIIDYYPNVNKVLIRKTNKWIKPGLRWIIGNLTT